MATRIIPAAPGTGGRDRKQGVGREVVTEIHGPVRSYGPCPLTAPPNQVIHTGGSSMIALLGPDLGDGQRRGTPTNANSLQPVMGLLNANSVKSWKAGHMLNAEFGGNGNSDANLTPLTTAANNAHRVFEGHIKRMLLLCNQLDRADANVNEWYCVLYAVTVSPTTYANAPATNDMHSYAYSHISLQYGFVKLPKFPPLGAPPHAMPAPPNVHGPVALADPKLAQLTGVVRPNFAPSVNIVNWLVVANMNGVNGIGFSVEVHNEP